MPEASQGGGDSLRDRPAGRIRRLRETTELGRVSAVVCTYTEARFEQLREAVGSLSAQTAAPEEILVVVDHNTSLLERARSELPGAKVLASSGPSGLSGARNTGVRAAAGEIVAFLDDDARADPGWLAALVVAFADPAVAGAGGLAVPAWPGATRPAWFPPAFDWVVGCSYEGLPTREQPVRNLLGAGMALRRSVLEAVGGFDCRLGRSGSLPAGCEETELGIRVSQQLPGMVLLHVPAARVTHHVSHKRTSPGYFVRRCFAEGVSKSSVAALVGRRDALSTEWRYVGEVLPRAVARDLFGRRRAPGRLRRALAVSIGLGTTLTGYLFGRLRRLVRSRD